MPLNRVWIPTDNHYGPRAITRLLIVHTAEGARTFEDLGRFFQGTEGGDNPTSSNVGIDSTPGTIGEFVAPDNGSWAAGAFNGEAAQVELCAFAEWTTDEWFQHDAMLSNLAAWLAEEAARYGLPLVKLDAQGAQTSGRGVCGHADLGYAGGGHWDPGPNFPWVHVLEMATGSSPGAPDQPSETGDNMICSDPLVQGGVWVADRTGAVFAYDGAPYCGGANNPAHNPLGWPCVGIAPNGDDGYVLVLDADNGTTGDRYRRFRYPRDGSAAV